jgi:CubicO group peptidase (beta-lactamase class C family)
VHRAAIVPLVVLALLFGAPLAPTTARQTATPATSAGVEGLYRDPAGRFTVPIPTNWTVDERSGYVVFSDPDGDITISAVVVAGTDAKTGIVDGWAVVDPSFDPNNQPQAIEQEVPSSPGVEKTLVITYDLGQVSGQVVQAAGQVVGGHVYVLIFEGTLEAVTRRVSQIQIISSGFKITGVAETDLTGVTPKRFDGELVREFESYVEDLMARLQVPGAAVAVVQNGKMVYAKGFGVKEKGGNEPVTPNTLMMIGSTTKSMTTMMMASEVDDGVMRWDEPVVDVLPSFAVADPDLTKKITVRNLVCACTGVPRRDLELVFNAGQLTPEGVIASLKGFQFYTKFGEAFQYSNQMVATGGYAAAAAAGGRYGELGEAYATQLRRRVLDPIGMDRTTLSFADVEADGDYATPHGLRLDNMYTRLSLATEAFIEPVAPAGAIWSSANEMARYALTELGRGVAPDGTRVVSAANLEETWQPQVAVDAETSYGLGWFIGEYKGLKLIDHGGNTFGFTSDLAFLPDQGIGIVVLANAQGSTLFNEGVRSRLFELLFDQPEEYDQQIAFAEQQTAQSEAALAKQLADRADREAAAPYVGRYQNQALGEVTIAFANGRLYIDAGEFRSELRPLKQPVSGQPAFLMFDPPLAGLAVDLRRDADGRPEVSIKAGPDEYDFAVIETGTPRASPVAVGSPEAT